MNRRSHQVTIRSANYVIDVLDTVKRNLPKTGDDPNVAILIISINRCTKSIKDEIDFVRNVNYFLANADCMKVELSPDVLSLLNQLKTDYEGMLTFV